MPTLVQNPPILLFNAYINIKKPKQFYSMTTLYETPDIFNAYINTKKTAHLSTPRQKRKITLELPFSLAGGPI